MVKVDGIMYTVWFGSVWSAGMERSSHIFHVKRVCVFVLSSSYMYPI